MSSSKILELTSFKELQTLLDRLEELVAQKVHEFVNKQTEIFKLNHVKNSSSPPPQNSTSPNNSEELDSNSSSGNIQSKYKSALSESHNNHKLPKFAAKILKLWFNEHIENPYPSKEEKVMLASKTNLTLRQINNWFVNQRGRKGRANKSKKKFINQIKNRLMMNAMNQEIQTQLRHHHPINN